MRKTLTSHRRDLTHRGRPPVLLPPASSRTLAGERRLACRIFCSTRGVRHPFVSRRREHPLVSENLAIRTRRDRYSVIPLTTPDDDVLGTLLRDRHKPRTGRRPPRHPHEFAPSASPTRPRPNDHHPNAEPRPPSPITHDGRHKQKQGAPPATKRKTHSSEEGAAPTCEMTVTLIEPRDARASRAASHSRAVSAHLCGSPTPAITRSKRVAVSPELRSKL